jgi:choline dehydrogenase
VDEYDYIVVGGGTAGCVVAARLSEVPGTRVLLLEAGSTQPLPAMSVPAAWPELMESAADWGYRTTPQAEAGPVAYPRGRALGGSGAINAMAHFRGHAVVYDRWPPGWRYQDLLPYFRRSEHTVGRDPALRGTDGPVRVAPVPEASRHPVARAFAAALAAAGCPVTDDLSGARQEGVGWPDLAIADGRRVGPADAYLRPAAGRPKLTVRGGCVATWLIIERGRCSGVRYLSQGLHAGARAAAEVIVCAGAIGTPKLLMLSGIGPARQLRGLGIDPVADLPDVGQNLVDHPVVMVTCQSAEPLPGSRYNHGEMYAELRSPLAGTWPDLQLFPILLPLAAPGFPAPDAGFNLSASVVAPDSRGSVALTSADPSALPVIDPGFLREGRDVDRLETGVELIRSAAADDALARLGTEVVPGPEVRAGPGLRQYIRRGVGSHYHPAGTCRLGADDSAVLDLDLRVRGVRGVRVVDASVLPVIPNAPLNATVLAVAEKAASLITKSRHQVPSPSPVNESH